MKNTLAIYYATMTGNAEELARDAETCIRRTRWLPLLHNLSEASPQSIQETSHAVFIVSTWGDGEPPEDAVDFFDELEAFNGRLDCLNYAILGLGDSSYPDFNAFARNLDQRLKELGANRFCERIEADFDFDDSYSLWMSYVLEKLENESKTLV